jgi:hypothetical protein
MIAKPLATIQNPTAEPCAVGTGVRAASRRGGRVRLPLAEVVFDMRFLLTRVPCVRRDYFVQRAASTMLSVSMPLMTPAALWTAYNNGDAWPLEKIRWSLLARSGWSQS